MKKKEEPTINFDKLGEYIDAMIELKIAQQLSEDTPVDERERLGRACEAMFGTPCRHNHA